MSLRLFAKLFGQGSAADASAGDVHSAVGAPALAEGKKGSNSSIGRARGGSASSGSNTRATSREIVAVKDTKHSRNASISSMINAEAPTTKKELKKAKNTKKEKKKKSRKPRLSSSSDSDVPVNACDSSESEEYWIESDDNDGEDRVDENDLSFENSDEDEQEAPVLSHTGSSTSKHTGTCSTSSSSASNGRIAQTQSTKKVKQKKHKKSKPKASSKRQKSSSKSSSNDILQQRTRATSKTSDRDIQYETEEIEGETQPLSASSSPSTSATSSSGSTNSFPVITWRRGGLLGSGSYGSVFMGLNVETGELIAVKQVPLGQALVNSKELVALEREVEILQRLNHERIVRYLGTSQEDDMLNIFLEYVPGGSLHGLIQKFGCFPEDLIRMYTRQILEGIHYLHENRIVHRDIKGANILLDHSGSIKLADFGASKVLEEVVNKHRGAGSLKGTIYWMAPEVVRQESHGEPADIWSLGCTVVEMAQGKPPWHQFTDQVSALFHIAKTQTPPELPAELSQAGKDFLMDCFEIDPQKRISAKALLDHPFVRAAASTTRKCYSSPNYDFIPPAEPRHPRSAFSNDLPQLSASCSDVNMTSSAQQTPQPVANPFLFVRGKPKAPSKPSASSEVTRKKDKKQKKDSAKLGKLSGFSRQKPK